MSERTIFEQIVDGDIPAQIVYETDDVVAFLDANPLATGHTLVVPKEPYTRLHDTPPELSTAVFNAVHTLSGAISNAVDADSTTIGINDGAAAGQEVPHLHVHIIPRFDGDGGGTIHSVMQTASPPDERSEEVAKRIIEQLE